MNGILADSVLVGKIIYLAVVMVVAALVQHIVHKALSHALDAAGVPRASIFINIVRVLIWFLALLLVLQPVFGVEPTAIVAALGVTSIIISLGMQDTISNVVGGISLMSGKVVKVGDAVSVGGKAGTITDITWRNTVLALRDGNTEVIPNSVLSKTALTRLTDNAADACSVGFVVDAEADPATVEREAVEAVVHSLGALADREREPVMRFGEMDAHGVRATVTAFAAKGQTPSAIIDRMSRALIGMPWLARINREA